MTREALDRLKASDNPVRDINNALDKLDNLQSVDVTPVRGGAFFVQTHLNEAVRTQPPNISVRGFTPNPGRIDENFSFTFKQGKDQQGQDVTMLSGIDGMTGSVTRRKTRFSVTDSITLGKEPGGTPYMDVSSSVHVRRNKWRGSGVRLYEDDFNGDSSMRSLMHQPESLTRMKDTLRMFQGTSDMTKFNLTNNGDGTVNLKGDFKNDKKIELNETMPEHKLTVESLELGKTMAAKIRSEKDYVALENIEGMTATVATQLGTWQLKPVRAGLRTGADGKTTLELEVANPYFGDENLNVQMPLTKPGEKPATVKLSIPYLKLLQNSMGIK